MTQPDERAQMRDQERRAERAIRRQEEAMDAEERRLEREMESAREAEEQAERKIEEEWRKEHWGREPERPPAWHRRSPGRA